jgi:hypothetical protein
MNSPAKLAKRATCQRVATLQRRAEQAVAVLALRSFAIFVPPFAIHQVLWFYSQILVARALGFLFAIARIWLFCSQTVNI